MKLRLRQIAGVAGELSPVEQQICRVLGVEVCYRDKGVAYFGLENALFPIGNQLLDGTADFGNFSHRKSAALAWKIILYLGAKKYSFLFFELSLSYSFIYIR